MISIIAKATRNNLQSSKSTGSQKPSKERVSFRSTRGEAGGGVRETGDQAMKDSPQWNFMVYLNKADERKHQTNLK